MKIPRVMLIVPPGVLRGALVGRIDDARSGDSVYRGRSGDGRH